MYRVTPNLIIDGAGYQLLVPSALQALVLESVHDKWGHQGTSRTLALLKAKCFWPGMRLNVKQHIQKCAQCLISKAPLLKIRPPMQHLLAFKPLELLASRLFET